MRYHALATDYDGTLATQGRVSDEVIAVLELVRQSGRRLVLVTGRHTQDLLHVFDRPDLFEWIVTENGAVLYHPSTREERVLAAQPGAEFVNALRQRNVDPVSVGQVIVSTWEPHESAVLSVIREMGLELQLIFNKGAVMILPSGVNKATGLAAALREMNLSPHNVIGVGDAENDIAFLGYCGFSIAVANALPSVRQEADFVTTGHHGDGVIELAEMLVATDLGALMP